jgi:hypothetical protein
LKIPDNAIKYEDVGNCTLVLFNWSELSELSSPRIWENVEFFDKDGKKLWTVNGMEDCPYWDKNADMFVGIGRDGEKWILNSYSGHSFFLEIKSGYVEYSGFQK